VDVYLCVCNKYACTYVCGLAVQGIGKAGVLLFVHVEVYKFAGVLVFARGTFCCAFIASIHSFLQGSTLVLPIHSSFFILHSSFFIFHSSLFIYRGVHLVYPFIIHFFIIHYLSTGEYTWSTLSFAPRTI